MGTDRDEMARRSKTSLENDIERSRWEEKWENIPKLVEQLSSRTTTESSIGKCIIIVDLTKYDIVLW